MKTNCQATATFYELAFGFNSKHLLWNADFKTAKKVAKADTRGTAKTGNPGKNVAMDMAPIYDHVAASLEAANGDITQVESRVVYENTLVLLGTDCGLRNRDCCKIPMLPRVRRWPDNCELWDCHRWELFINRDKGELLREGGGAWSKTIIIKQNHRNRTKRYRYSLLSVWFAEYQRRMEVLQAKKPQDFPPEMVDGIRCNLQFMFRGLDRKGQLSLVKRGMLSADSISNARQRVMSAAGIPSELSPRHLRPGTANMLYHIGVVEMKWMTMLQLQQYLRHQEGSKITEDAYLAVTINTAVWQRWNRLTLQEKRSIKTHSCIVRV